MVRPALAVLCALTAVAVLSAGQAPPNVSPLDAQVSRFLEQHRGTWRDLNVPDADGRALRDLVVERTYTRALEIGTSTGHSGIWIAWGLAATGGRLVTIDIDADRQREALRNFKEAGVAGFIDSRLGDAHEIVPALPGPFDLVFIDADKDWYTNYAKAVLPKLKVGGALTAHNVSRGGRRGMTGDFYDYVTGLAAMDSGFRAGVFVAFKTK